MNFRDMSGILATWVGLVAAVAGGYTTIRSYVATNEKQVDERKLQTFRLVERFGAADMIAIRNKILPLVVSDQFCRADQRQAVNLSDNEAFQFVEFFDTIGTCLDARLCDGDVAYSFFGAYANWHWPRMKGFVEQVRRGEKDFDLPRPYGHGLEAMARKPVAASRCNQR